MLKTIHKISRSLLFSFLTICLTIFSAFILSSTFTFANDSVVDDVSISVSVACTMNGTGMNTHNATIVNGTSNSAIGETTMKVFCNDAEGFAIYAIGYTDDTDGKNVLTSSTLGSNFDIATGTATGPVGNNDSSQWAMKLTIPSSPTPTYPLTIQNSFNSFHIVPTDYTLVAKRTSGTDVGTNAEGSTIKSTYQAYISKTQPAGTYSGKVKYVLVHPNDTSAIPVKSDQIAVIYNGNGLTFSGGASENRVVYGGENCEPMYIGNTPTIIKSSNLTANGEKTTSYKDENIIETISFDGADKIMVTLDYATSFYTMIYVSEGEWDGDIEHLSGDYYTPQETMYDVVSGRKTLIFDNDTITIGARMYGWYDDGYDYGFYAKVYPVYETEQNNTTKKPSCSINSTPIDGSYAETSTFYDKWFINNNGNVVWLEDENEILDYLENNQLSLAGSTIYIYAYNQYSIIYNGNNATAGNMNGFSTSLDHTFYTVQLAGPNYYKTNYGFAGWSENPNATVNSNDKIFGPNEVIKGTDLNFNNSTHEDTLYAVWVPSAGNLQGWSGCSSLSQGQVTALTDTRDNNTYAIAKLADGNCWMLENLRLDSANSSDSTKAQGFGGVFTGLADSESANFSNSTTANSKYSTSIITGSNQAYRFPRYNNSNISSITTSPSSLNSNIYGYGNYYTYAAAMANTSDLTTESASESANTSICPFGWGLPYGNSTSNGSFYYLNYKIYNDTNVTNSLPVDNELIKHPNNFYTESGYMQNSTRIGTISYYWSLTSKNSDLTYSYALAPNYLDANQQFYKYYGASVRCVILGN